MAPTYIAAFVGFIASILSNHGVIIDPVSLTTTLVNLISILAPVFIMLRQWLTNRATLIGTRPK